MYLYKVNKEKRASILLLIQGVCVFINNLDKCLVLHKMELLVLNDHDLLYKLLLISCL